MRPRLGRVALHGEIDEAQHVDGGGEVLEAELDLGVRVGVGVGLHAQPDPIWRRAVNPIRMARRGSMRSRLGTGQEHGGRVHHRQQPHQPGGQGLGERNRISTG